MSAAKDIAVREKEDRSAATRDIILDATEDIMRTDGYAAVSSRRVAERTGMRSRVVHYHFGSMDDLFIALIRRIEERYFGQYEALLEAADPVEMLWPRIMASIDSAILSEMTAMSLHRAAVRDVIVVSLERARRNDIRLMERLIKESGIEHPGLSPTVLAVLMAGLIRVLAAERTIGMQLGHDEVLDYVRRFVSGPKI